MAKTAFSSIREKHGRFKVCFSGHVNGKILEGACLFWTVYIAIEQHEIVPKIIHIGNRRPMISSTLIILCKTNHKCIIHFQQIILYIVYD